MSNTEVPSEISMPGRQIFVFMNIAKLHQFPKNFSVYKCNTLKLNEFKRLVKTVLAQISHNREIKNIFLKTITIATRLRQCSLWLITAQQRQLFSRDRHLCSNTSSYICWAFKTWLIERRIIFYLNKDQFFYQQKYKSLRSMAFLKHLLKQKHLNNIVLTKK